MLSNPLIATVLVFSLIALGEWISIITKARIPMLLTAMIGFLICSWTGVFSSDILEKSQLPAFGAILIGPVILHMGTLIPFSLLKSQIKAVIIAMGGLIISGVLILSSITLIFDYPTAVSGVGPVTGGVIALLVTSERLTDIGLASLVVVPALVAAFQGVLGMPLALNIMRKYATQLQTKMDNGTFVPMATDEEINGKSSDQAKMGPIKSSMTLKLFFVFVGGAIGIFLGEITPIHYSLWCLAIGVVGLKFGLFEPKTLEKSNSFTMSMIAIIFVVIGTMADVTPQQALSNLPSIILILLIGTIGLIIGGYITSKLVKWDPLKGMPVALTALFGFPGDYILCDEVARSIGRNKQEEKAIFNELLSPMLIGGFTTVTVVSVAIAGILVQTL